MDSAPLDWRTLRLCEPEQARFLVRAAAAGVPFFIAVSMIGSVTHSVVLPLALIVVYLLALGALALRLFSSAKETLARLDPDRVANRRRPAWATAEMPGEVIERRVSLAMAAVDRFRAHYRSPLTLLAVICTGVLLGFAGLGLISAMKGSGGADAAPPSSLAGGRTATRTFTVESTAASAARGGIGMLDTGIVLRGKATVTILASGTMSCVNMYSWCTVGPAGDSSFKTTLAEVFPLPGAPAWGLIAQVGTGPIKFVGEKATIGGNGRLVLGVNDNYPFDNLGYFSVSVTYACGLVTATHLPGIADPCAAEP